MYLKKFLQPFFTITGTAFKRWWAKDPFMQSAVNAYYAIFCIPDLLVIVISSGALLFKQDIIIGQLNTQISSIMGIETARQVQEMIIGIREADNSLLASIFGLITVLIGATGVFVELQKALNIIW